MPSLVLVLRTPYSDMLYWAIRLRKRKRAIDRWPSNRSVLSGVRLDRVSTRLLVRFVLAGGPSKEPLFSSARRSRYAKTVELADAL